MTPPGGEVLHRGWGNLCWLEKRLVAGQPPEGLAETGLGSVRMAQSGPAKGRDGNRLWPILGGFWVCNQRVTRGGIFRGKMLSPEVTK